MFIWLRRYQILSDKLRGVIHIAVVTTALIGLMLMSRLGEARAQQAQLRINACEHWLNRTHESTKENILACGTAVREIIQYVDGVDIAIEDGHHNPVRGLIERDMYTWLATSSHVCVQSDARLQQTVIAIPKDRPEVAWLHKFGIPVAACYFKHGRNGEPISLHMDTAQEMGLASLATIAMVDPDLETRIREVGKAERFWIRFSEFLHSWAGHGCVGIFMLALTLLFSYHPLPSLVTQAAEEAGLDDARHDLLLAYITPEWVLGRPHPAIVLRLKTQARILQRVQQRERDRERREQLRKIAGEERTRKLHEQGQRQAELARKRLAQGETTLGEELLRHREEIRSEGTAVARVLESGFFEAIAIPDDNPVSVPEPDASTTATDKQRKTWINVIRSCANDIEGLEACEDSALTEIADRIRRVKRGLGHNAWKQLKSRFNTKDTEPFLVLLRTADNEGEEALLHKLDNRPSQRLLTQPPAFQADAPPRLLEGKRVIIMGGDPSIGPFYVEQIEKLGATVLAYHTDGNPSYLRRKQPDLFLLMFSRVDHNAVHMARSVGKPVIFLRSVSRSSFLQRTVEDLQKQTHVLAGT